MDTSYKEREMQRQEDLIKAKDEVFRGAEGGGAYKGNGSYDHVLADARCNFFEPIQAAAWGYFDENGISWRKSGGKKDNSTEVTKEGYDRGETRLTSYTDLINASRQLKPLESYEGSVYYRYPFYQMMRQTLWA